LSYLIIVFGKRRTAVAGFVLVAAASLFVVPVALAARFGSRMLQTGMQGADVTTLQHDLTASGFNTMVTGAFTTQTKGRVVAFQRHYRLTADGVVGPATFKRLGIVLKAMADKPDTAIRLTMGAGGGVGLGAATGTTANETQIVTPPPLSLANSGGASVVPAPSSSPVEKAILLPDGLAEAPTDAPLVVSEVIAAANAIAFKPYIYGGGHKSFNSAGYDCSGSVSYALHGGSLLASPIDSSQFESYGLPGAGRWITIYTDPGHAYMNVAGLWFDTAAQSAANGNDRWSTQRISSADGFTVRHPAGW
jgi:hypothetical protein